MKLRTNTSEILIIDVDADVFDFLSTRGKKSTSSSRPVYGDADPPSRRNDARQRNGGSRGSGGVGSLDARDGPGSAPQYRYSPVFPGDESLNLDVSNEDVDDDDVDDFLPRLQTLSEKFRLVFVLFKVLTKSSSLAQSLSHELQRCNASCDDDGDTTVRVHSGASPMVIPERLHVVDFSLDSKYMERVLLHAQFALLEPEKYKNFSSVQELIYRTDIFFHAYFLEFEAI